MQIKAIETIYKNYKFRSRLEARYAILFDSLGIKWDYEVEGYDLGELGWYLPDFYLPELNLWVEVKGAEATKDELKKCETLAHGTGSGCLLVQGTPSEGKQFIYCYSSCDSGGGWEWEEVILLNSDFDKNIKFLIKNPSRDQILLSIDYETSYPSFHEREYPNGQLVPKEDFESELKECFFFSKEAYIKAKQARFEHGETLRW